MPLTGTEVLNRLLSATLKLDTDAVTALSTEADRELFKDDAPELLLAKFTEHLETVRKSASDEGFGYGERKAHKDWRDSAKALGVKSDKKDPKDLLSELVGSKTPVEITEDVVKKSPTYIQIEQEFIGLKNSFDTKLQEQLAAKDAEYQRDRTLNLVTEHADSILMGLKPVLSKDPIKAKNQRKPFYDELRAFGYQTHDNDSFLVLDNSGKRLEDKLLHPIPFTEHVKSIAGKYFDFEQADERTSAGDPGKGATKGAVVNLPTDRNELAKMAYEMSRSPGKFSPEQIAGVQEALRKG